MHQPWKLIKNIGQLVTLGPLVQNKRVTKIKPKDLGILKNAWLLLNNNGSIHSLGKASEPPHIPPHTQVIDMKEALILPGFIDSHVHPIWAGSRAEEMARRLAGETYQMIAASGGGIASTVRATRSASNETLLTLALSRAEKLLHCGVTSFEAKSGYGLSIAEEVRHLRLLKQLKSMIPQTISATCLALHAASPEHPSRSSWIEECREKLLPLLVEEGLADAVDGFIEEGYFSVEEVESYFLRAKALGLKLRIHADEFSDAKAALAAARWQASSADHLQCAAPGAAQALAAAGVTVTLLPGTSLFTKLPFTQGRPYADAGAPVAIASDFNPGSCMIENLPMLAAIACVHAGLRVEEAVAGITLVPALSLGLGHRKGAIQEGYDGDFVVYHRMESLAAWIYDFGRTPPHEVWIQGDQKWSSIRT